MENTQDFNQKEAEKYESNILIDRGIKFTVEKQSFLKYFSKNKTRVFTIKQPFLGTLDFQTNLALDINFEETALKENPWGESKMAVKRNSKIMARIIAVAVLRTEFKIRLLSGILARYFYWRMEPSKLLQLSVLITKINNYGDFIDSIRLLSMIRTTAPTRIEGNRDQAA